MAAGRPRFKSKHSKFGGGRIEINEKEIQEQCDMIVHAFMAFPVNLRKKHISAALRRACTGAQETSESARYQYRGAVQSGSLAHAYVVEAKKFDKTREKSRQSVQDVHAKKRQESWPAIHTPNT